MFLLHESQPIQWLQAVFMSELFLMNLDLNLKSFSFSLKFQLWNMATDVVQLLIILNANNVKPFMIVSFW